MILNIERFVREERPYWEELERMLAATAGPRGLEDARRLFYLYRRAASGLVKLSSLAAGPEAQEYLEALVGRAYAEIHATQDAPARFQPVRWFFRDFPRAVRRHRRALWTSTAVTLAGALFGVLALNIDKDQAKSVIMPFPHLQGSPSERVQEEQMRRGEQMEGNEATFASMLMQNNIRVSIFAAALGLTYALGTLTLLFYNGTIIGAVAADYINDGQAVFLLGWLLPHGAIEIPAILIAGQAGLVLGRALIGHDTASPLRERMRETAPTLGYLLLGVAGMLVWAGIIEAFLSQYHEPVLPYWVKITFGTLELAGLAAFLIFAGRGADAVEAADE